MADNATSFEIQLTPTGTPSVEQAAAALQRLSGQMQTAQERASKAAQALADGDARYKALQSAADRASKALESVNVKMAAASGTQLEKLKARQAEAAQKADQAAAALKREAEAVDKLRAASKEADTGVEQLKKQQEQLTKAQKAAQAAAQAEAGEGGFEGVDRGLGRIGGPLGRLGQSVAGIGSGFEKLQKSLGATKGAAVAAAVGFVALAAAAVAVAVAVADATVKLAAMAVQASDTARTNQLLLDGIARSTQGGAMLNDKIGELQRTVPLTREELVQLASDASKAGLSGQALANQLDYAAKRAARAKFGPEWEKQMLSLSVQTDRLKSNFNELIGSLHIDRLLEGIQGLVSLFDDTNASGRALKTVFDSLFQPLIDGASSVVPKIRRAFLELEILALRGLIALKPYGHDFKELGALLENFGKLAGGEVATNVIIAAEGFGSLVRAVDRLVGMFQRAHALAENFAGRLKALFGVDRFLTMGRQMVQGLIDGITGAGPGVVSSLKGVVDNAVDSAKKFLGIHSPSTVFAEIGRHTAEGMAVGVDSGSGDVQSSLADMTTPPSVSKPTAAPATSGGKGGASVNLAGASFVFNGVKGAEDAEERFGALLTRLLEGDVAQLGGGVPA